VLGDYLNDLLALRDSELSVTRKTKQALFRTADPNLARILTTTAANAAIDLAWRDRSWAARLGLSAATLAAVTTGGQSAGIAALGSAIGVPLWVVFGAGGAFAGVVLDEIGHLEKRHGAEESSQSSRADRRLGESTDPKQIEKELDRELSGLREIEWFDEQLGLETNDVTVADPEEDPDSAVRLGRAWNQLVDRLRLD
jgi:hypothetical protein